MSMGQVRRALLIGLLLGVAVSSAWAGPPYLTDDAETPEAGCWELNLSCIRTRTSAQTQINQPLVDVNYGVRSDLEATLELPLNHVSGTGMPSNTGLGDALVGMKWCFRDQGEGWPKLGLLPQMTLPTGAADRGLGAGKATYGLPLLVEYERKSWLAFVNVGYVWQQAAGASDYGYYGATVCHEAGRRWQFGGELLGRAASDVGGRSLLAYNLGGEYELRRDVSVLFSAGHSLKGEDTSLLYAGLQFQLGTGSEANSERRMAPTQLEAPSAQEH